MYEGCQPLDLPKVGRASRLNVCAMAALPCPERVRAKMRWTTLARCLLTTKLLAVRSRVSHAGQMLVSLCAPSAARLRLLPHAARSRFDFVALSSFALNMMARENIRSPKFSVRDS